MPRADLTAMLNRLDDDPQPTSTTKRTAPETPPTQKVQAKNDSPSKREIKTDSPKQPEPVESHTADTPLYLRLERKETRLRVDQYEALTVHARRLNRAKGPGGERITENTLIRVAIDLLLENAEKLSGPNESSLRDSVSP